MSERCLINQTGWSIYLERPRSRATSVLKCSTQKKLGLWLGLQFALDYSTFNLFEHENMACQVKKILHQNDLAKTPGKPKMLTAQHHKPNQETPKGYLVDRDCHRGKHQDTQRASNFYQTLPDQARPQSKVYILLRLGGNIDTVTLSSPSFRVRAAKCRVPLIKAYKDGMVSQILHLHPLRWYDGEIKPENSKEDSRPISAH